MKNQYLQVNWPNGQSSLVKPGKGWLSEAEKAGIAIPTGCLTGSCGACEIEVNGKITRACISNIPKSNSNVLNVEFSYDPFW